jgi:superfamily I DNA/RNA helicase
MFATLNEDQLSAVRASLEHPLMIQAGPGSGKTLTLTARVVLAIETNM